MRKFVHLQIHSSYSLLQSTLSIERIINNVKNNQQDACAITDINNLFGVVKFYEACKKENIRPIIGMDTYLEYESMSVPITLLCKNNNGYHNLIYLASYVNGEVEKCIPLDVINKYQEDLFIICHLSSLIYESGRIFSNVELEKKVIYLKFLFQDSLYLSIQNVTQANAQYNEYIEYIGKKAIIPIVATNPCCLENDLDVLALDCLNAIKNKNKIQKNTHLYNNQHRIKNTLEMIESIPYNDAIENTIEIASKCNVELFDHTYIFPKFNENKDSYVLLSELTYQGFEQRKNELHLDENSDSYLEYLSRIKYELSIIHQMNFDDYFLVVADFVNYAKRHDVPVGPGRGSGAGSLVAYCLNITEFDPIKYHLIFERFLNPQRNSMPDFDIDFGDIKRDEMVKYVQEKYGYENTCHIISFSNFTKVVAVNDLCKVFDIQIDANIKNLLLNNETDGEALKSHPQLIKINEIASRIVDLPKYYTIHPAGVVITQKNVQNYTPTIIYNNKLVSQYNMDDIAKIGLVKYDFLTLTTATFLNLAEKNIQLDEPSFRLKDIPLSDAKTFQLISSGDTFGIFQLESKEMTKFIMELKPQTIEDLVAAIALFRPGPMSFIPQYIKNRQNKKNVQYKIDALKEILDETYGCIIYQEQVMAIFQKIGSYSMAKADLVRRAISKKEKEILLNEKECFISGAIQNGYKKEDVEELFETIVNFSAFAFNKSHALSYGILSYQTAYIKANYPIDYYISFLNSNGDDTDVVNKTLKNLSSKNIQVLPPDIHKSKKLFSKENGSIRFGIYFIKEINNTIAEWIENENSRKLFSSYNDFIERITNTLTFENSIEVLIKVGFFDSIEPNRKLLANDLHKKYTQLMYDKQKNIDGQISFFDFVESQSIKKVDIKDYSIEEKQAMEMNYLHFVFSQKTYQLFVKLNDLTNLETIKNICIKYPGKDQVIIYNNEFAKYMPTNLLVNHANADFVKEMIAIVPRENIVLKCLSKN